MRTTLLESLCCPFCTGSLALEVGQCDADHVMEGSLRCEACRGEFPIRAGVPRLLPRSLAPDLQATARRFGESWKIWSSIDLDRYRSQFLEWLTPLGPEDFRGRRILDGGCGKGRHLLVARQLGSSQAIGVDLSDAVDVAFQHTRHDPGIHVVQGDIHHLPLKGGFDIALGVGVLHHTPDPRAAFTCLASQARPGGTVACWVYGRENNGWIYWLVNPVRVGLTSHAPALLLRGMALLLGLVLLVLIHAIYRPGAALGLGLFYHDYMLYLGRLGFREIRAIVFDHLTAPTAHYLPRAEVESWMAPARVRLLHMTWVRRMSWAAIGQREAAGPEGGPVA